MQYSYKAKDNKGQLANGTLSANSQSDAVEILRQQKLFVISVKEQSGSSMQADELLSRFSHVGFSQIVDFTRQLATMLNAGLSLVESLSLLESQTPNPAFKKILGDILLEIKGGGTLEKALGKHPEHFNKIFISLISAGEKSGKLDDILLRLADTLEAQRAFQGQVKTAMIYPTIVVFGMVGLATLMMVVVVPQLTEVYNQFDVELPITTQIMITTSNIVVHYWWALLIAAAAFFIWLPLFSKSPIGMRVIDTVTLHLPVWGSLKKDTVMTELTRTLALLIKAGVPILDSLEIVAENNSVCLSFGQFFIIFSTSCIKPMSSILSASSKTRVETFVRYPPIFSQMVKVGEQTGKMDETLSRISIYFETSGSEKVKRLTASLEPLILGVLGIGVGFLVFSIVMPMYQLTQAF